jgi:hypothetical protein
LPGRDNAANTRRELCVILDMPAKDVADADVDQVEIGLEQLGLRAFAAPLNTHENVLVHDHTSMPMAGTSARALLFLTIPGRHVVVVMSLMRRSAPCSL